ncbi:MAG: WecB/TagA/CpsF family glycosyltransferase [Pseudonocardia sp.]|nr:WecB/TagA/CpsF family glycosyltransferase [Pseudonocardia sp.]
MWVESNSHDSTRSLSTVRVGPFTVADASSRSILEWVTETVRAGIEPSTVLFALHVGGLLHRHDERYVGTMNRSSLTYADGWSIVLLARLGRAERIGRASTTDIGQPLIARLAQVLGRPVRIGIIGGPPGLADRAAPALLTTPGECTVVFTADGYQKSYAREFQEMSTSPLDVLIVGMGMPREALWVEQNRPHLRASVVLTCGGWLGFLAGTESRAPEILQRFGLEWTWRLLQDPRRLWLRYARGLGVVAAMTVTAAASHLRRPTLPRSSR